MNYQSYPNYDLELLESYKYQIELILQELKNFGVHYSLIRKVSDLKSRIDFDIEQIQLQGQRIVPYDE